MKLPFVAVRKEAAVMSPCKTCGASAYEGCKAPGHDGTPIGQCAQYTPTSVR
jgi:hypothetical protein